MEKEADAGNNISYLIYGAKDPKDGDFSSCQNLEVEFRLISCLSEQPTLPAS